MTVCFFWSDLSKMDQTWSNFLSRNGFLAVMASLQKLLFVQKYLCQFWSDILAKKGLFSKESAFFLKVLKGLARLYGWKLSGSFFPNSVPIIQNYEYAGKFWKFPSILSKEFFLNKKIRNTLNNLFFSHLGLTTTINRVSNCLPNYFSS